MRTFIMIAALIFATAPPVVPGAFHGCGVEGSAKDAKALALDRLKNRAAEPTAIDRDVTAAALFAPGDDRARFSTDQAATIRVYVSLVKPGGPETSNCGARHQPDLDAHIEANAVGPDYRGLPMILEVTPRWQDAMRARGGDWSVAGLKAKIERHWVDVTGWLLADVEHVGNATNTNPRGKRLWRATIWEVHPVSAIRVLD